MLCRLDEKATWGTHHFPATKPLDVSKIDMRKRGLLNSQTNSSASTVTNSVVLDLQPRFKNWWYIYSYFSWGLQTNKHNVWVAPHCGTSRVVWNMSHHSSWTSRNSWICMNSSVPRRGAVDMLISWVFFPRGKHKINGVLWRFNGI